jgi:hypothetical protein
VIPLLIRIVVPSYPLYQKDRGRATHHSLPSTLWHSLTLDLCLLIVN